MKYFILVSSLLVLNCTITKQKTNELNNHSKEIIMENNKSIYDFKVEDIEGNLFDLASLKGKKVMIVNTASECGLTPQFEQLQSLYTEFKDHNFTIIGFPTNDFMGQDPGTNQEIASFCQKNYGVTFPMMAKIKVKGKDKHPLYNYLTSKAENGLDNYKIEWNFQKFLIDENGKIAKVISPRTLPNDSEIKDWIKGK